MIQPNTSTGLIPPTPAFAWPTAPLDPALLAAYLAACVARGVAYGLGAKAPESTLGTFPPCFTAIDCSGWVRAAVAYATRARLILPDGSVNQHDWADRVGLKASSWASLLLKDGIVRIAFIAPNGAHPVGHVYLCKDRRTMESYGGNGPGSRSPLVQVLHARTTAVYVLEIPANVAS